METTERIVESYCRYVKGWFTISNIKCPGQLEVDILAIDPINENKRYHIECGVSVSGTYSKLTAKPFSLVKLRGRVEQAGQRRTIGYFIERKFNPPEVISELKKYGFKRKSYTKVIVTWGWTPEAELQASSEKIMLWDFRDILEEIADSCRNKSSYYPDDTMRTIQLFLRTSARK